MQEITFDLGHIKLAGLAFGDPSKPVILATHGWLDNAASFIPIAPYLEDYYVVAVDFAGHGLSEQRPIGAHYHILDNIYDLHTLVRLQGWDDVILLGHSMGGILASVYASSFPDVVKAMVMLEAFGPLTKEAASSPEQLRDSVQSRLNIAEKVQHHPRSLDSAVQARLMAGEMTQTSAELLMHRNIRITNDGLEWRTDLRLRTLSPLRLTEGQADAFLAGVKCPSFSILGAQGFEDLKEKQAAKRHLMPQFKSAECEGAHHLHMDNPEEIAREIKSFLSAHLNT